MAAGDSNFTNVVATNDITASGDLNLAGAKVANNVTAVLSAGAANTMTITITVKDADAAAIAAIHNLEVWISDSATGSNLTSAAASGALTATTGAILTAITAKKHVHAVTDANGVLVLSLVDTAKSTGQYAVVKNPVSGKLHLSAASVTGSYG